MISRPCTDEVKHEQERIQRLLHDTLGQTIFSAAGLAEMLPILSQKDPENFNDYIQKVAQLTRQAADELRMIMNGLSGQ